MQRFWYIWAKALGNKPENLSDRDADLACLLRTLFIAIPAVCIIANFVIQTLHTVFGFWN